MKVICLTDITGMPFGEATAQRVIRIGKAVVFAGGKFEVYTIYFNKLSQNKDWKGFFDGIYFEYLHKNSNLNIHSIKKVLLRLYAYLRLFFMLLNLTGKSNVVYIFSHGKVFNLIVIILCKFFRLRIVQEINEWDFRPDRYSFRQFMFKVPMIKWSDGAIVISESIKQNVLKIKADFPNIKIPILSDSEQVVSKKKAGDEVCYYGLWVGLVNDYLDDVLLFGKAVQKLADEGLNIQAVVCGRYSEKSRSEIYSIVSPNTLSLKGYVSDDELNLLCQNASFFLAPLWEDQKSENRFPTKIASYFHFAKPVITCPIGEVKANLTDNLNVLFFRCGNVDDLVGKIKYLYCNPQISKQIGLQGKEFAERIFDYRNYSSEILKFFNKVMDIK